MQDPSAISRRPLVLCIDDDEVVLRVRKLLLSGSGYEVLTASSGETGLDLFHSHPIDLVVSDHFLSDGKGTEIARQMKALKPDVPILIASGGDRSVDLQFADGFISKGEPPHILLDTMAELIALRSEKARLGHQAQTIESEIYLRVQQLEEANRQLRTANEDLARLDLHKDQQLWEYRNRLALIVDSSRDAIIGKDLHGNITSWNNGAERMYGYTAEEVIGKPITILAPPERHEEISRILASIRDGKDVEHIDTARVTKEGKLLEVSIAVSPIRDSSRTIVGASTIARDITAQKRAEDQVRQSQKMEAVGQLAGGVAHDFNNILGIITSCAELLKAQVGDDPLPLELLGHIRDAAIRGASVTRQLLAFSRKQPVKSSVMDLNQRLRDVCKLLLPLLGDDIEISFAPRSNSALIEADPGQIDQIVLNLAVNARDAMPQGGKFVLETSTTDLDEDTVRQHPPMKPGKYVMLAVSDNGCGMDSATSSRIFEPFFTTKEVGKGTGLGLSTVYGIVQQSGGHILTYSERGHGTTFKIYLPSMDERVGVASPPDDNAFFQRGEGKTVLLVEDNAVIRRVIRQMLADQGYAVIEAEDGRSGLLTANSHKGRLDLVLTDIVMPGLNGPELVSQLKSSHPEISVLYMSGYASEFVMDRGLRIRGTVLEKPFTRAALLSAVEAASPAAPRDPED